MLVFCVTAGGFALPFVPWRTSSSICNVPPVYRLRWMIRSTRSSEACGFARVSVFSAVTFPKLPSSHAPPVFTFTCIVPEFGPYARRLFK
jgi:hypothetical protein